MNTYQTNAKRENYMPKSGRRAALSDQTRVCGSLPRRSKATFLDLGWICPNFLCPPSGGVFEEREILTRLRTFARLAACGMLGHGITSGAQGMVVSLTPAHPFWAGVFIAASHPNGQRASNRV
jgi:hypothetical protein